MKTNTPQPALILVRGLPGSGKSYLSDAVARAIGSGSVVVLDPDATDYDSVEYKAFSDTLTSQDVDKKFHPYRYLRTQAHRAIEQHKSIIWNQAFTHEEGFQKTIHNLTEYADSQKTPLKILVVEVNVDPDTARQRIHEREATDNQDRSVPDDAFERFVRDYRSFSHLGYSTIAIDGNNNITDSTESVMNYLHTL